MKRTWIMTLMLVALAMTATAQAQTPCDELTLSMSMVATPTGDSYDASGYLKGAVHADCSESLGVLVSAKLPDGTQLVIEGTTARGTIQFGSVTMFMGVGEFFKQSDKDVSDLFPLAELQSLVVRFPQGRGARGLSPILLEATL